jgi:chemotaxis protein methyltransferase WspC
MDEFQDDWLVDVELLVRRRIGLNPQAVNQYHIRDAVHGRMAACRIENLSNYLACLKNREDEFQELVERLIVPESWFFRDLQPFRFLEHYVSTRWQPRHPKRPLRLLSVPCGTGEEPFSMAVTLLNLGLDRSRFRVDGVDISQRVLREAETGSFGELSFREREETVANHRARYFQPVRDRFVVNQEVRSAVHFRHASIVDPAFLDGESAYDVVFCRNLLIYLDADARRTALASLHRLLDDEGVLYVGHVEAGAVKSGQFDAYSADFPFAFRPTRGESNRLTTGVGNEILPSRIPPAAPALAKPPALSGEDAVRWPPRLSQEEPKADGLTIAAVGDPQAEFVAAREAADRGLLEKSAAACLDLLAKQAPRADVYCLLGEVRQAQGDADEAEKCFHKALYLDPRHYHALVHLTLLARQRGEESLAMNYRRRADKIQSER